MTVYTRLNSKGKYICYGTISGYDYSFDGLTQDQAQKQMLETIKYLKVKPDDVKWEPVEKQVKFNYPSHSKSMYRRIRLDNF